MDSTVAQIDYFMELGAPFARVCEMVVRSGKVDLIAHVHTVADCPWWYNGPGVYCLKAVIKTMKAEYYKTHCFEVAFAAGRLAGQIEVYGWWSTLFLKVFKFRV